MTHKRKAPMWARLKATKKALKALRAVVIRQASELQTAKFEANRYEEGYKWALAMLADVTERETRYVKQMGEYVESNIELKRQVNTLTAQLENPESV